MDYVRCPIAIMKGYCLFSMQYFRGKVTTASDQALESYVEGKSGKWLSFFFEPRVINLLKPQGFPARLFFFLFFQIRIERFLLLHKTGKVTVLRPNLKGTSEGK